MLYDIVQPFLDGIREYTGLTLCLLGGAAPADSNDKFQIFA